MKAICILQVRMDSERLYGKAVADISGHPMLTHIIGRLKKAKTIEKIVVATTVMSEDDIIAEIAENCGVVLFRGQVDNVLGRITRAALEQNADIIANATGDNPLVDPKVLDILVKHSMNGGYDLTFMAGIPLGLGVDVFSKDALLKMDRLSSEPKHREHINSYIFDNINEFKVLRLLSDDSLMKPQIRLTVDTHNDLKLMRDIYKRLYNRNIIDVRDVMKLYESESNLFSVNSGVEQLYVSENAKKLRSSTNKLKIQTDYLQSK